MCEVVNPKKMSSQFLEKLVKVEETEIKQWRALDLSFFLMG